MSLLRGMWKWGCSFSKHNTHYANLLPCSYDASLLEKSAVMKVNQNIRHLLILITYFTMQVYLLSRTVYGSIYLHKTNIINVYDKNCNNTMTISIKIFFLHHPFRDLIWINMLCYCSLYLICQFLDNKLMKDDVVKTVGQRMW